MIDNLPRYADQTIACFGKIAYASMVEAHKALKHIRKRRHEAGLEPYRCKYCAGYHIGRNAALYR